ncbi:hypothetical protein JCM10450v2_001630 [Rhodotorula kratochvilovae]
MASLPDLEQVTQLSPYVTRILGENPGKFTLQGTNSYLVHHPSSTDVLLIDSTGPSSSSPLPPASLRVYTSSLLRALSSHPVQPARVSDILLTHWHGDHVDALRAVLDALPRAEGSEGARVWKAPCAEGPAWDGEEGKDAAIEQSLAGALADGRLQPAEAGRAVRPLKDGQRFALSALPAGAESEDAQAEVEVEVLHTPGHTSDSICLLLHRASSATPLALFTADTILGHGSSVFASLSAYMSSLSTLLARLPPSAEGEVPLYPGHGAPVADARAKVAEYAAHRTEREGQVVAALKERAGQATTTAGELTEQIYGNTIPASLIPAATHGLLLHLAKLQEEGRVARVPASAEMVAAGDSRAPPGWWDGWRWVEGEKENSPGRL